MTQGWAATGTEGDRDGRLDGALLWRRAVTAFKLRDYERAADILLSLLELHGEAGAPVSAGELRTLAGVTLLRLRRTEAGVEQLERAIALEPSSARANYKLGLGYGRLKRDEEALARFLRASALDPLNVEYLCRTGAQYQKLGLDDQAAASYFAALAIDPDCDNAKRELAKLGMALPGPITGPAT